MEHVRTCVGCRSRATRTDLLRVVVRGSVLVADQSAVLPGRGAWLHPTRECFDRAIQRRAFGRALRVRADLDSSAIGAALTGPAVTSEKAERHSDLK